MNTIASKTPGKRIYSKPEMKSIKIDNQISMVMMSDNTPPDDPGGKSGINLRNDNPYRINEA